MSVSFSQAFDGALTRTRRVLFEGFDPGRYLTIGFVAFLALLADGCVPSIGSGGLVGLGIGRMVLDAAPEPFGLPLASAVLLPLLALGAMLLTVALWLSARGQLIFIENVIYENPRLSEPWQRLGERARPLFVWTLGLAGATAVAMVVGWTPGWLLLRAVRDSSDAVAAAAILPAVAAVLFGLALTLAFAAAWVALHHFVVPLYYRDGGSVGQSWRKLLRLVGRRPFDFVLYGAALLALWVVVQAAVVALLVATCCIIDPLLRLPYLSTLFYLPLLVFVRAFSVEFLGQFGADYRIEPAAPEIG